MIKRILTHLGLQARAPPRAEAGEQTLPGRVNRLRLVFFMRSPSLDAVLEVGLARQPLLDLRAAVVAPEGLAASMPDSGSSVRSTAASLRSTPRVNSARSPAWAPSGRSHGSSIRA